MQTFIILQINLSKRGKRVSNSEREREKKEKTKQYSSNK